MSVRTQHNQVTSTWCLTLRFAKAELPRIQCSMLHRGHKKSPYRALSVSTAHVTEPGTRPAHHHPIDGPGAKQHL